jgi:DNA repair exonuclease SbcCD ATPase subunit
MLKKITLTNFRQHLDRTFEFGPGLNAVRGENEAGKTTVLEAFTYFCFGSGALRESLDDVVTYHQPVSRLRVDCELEHLGVTYRGYRGKSGAEVVVGNERITGQREVTKFFENLFGTSADMAGKLMFASQKSLAESLKAGPTAAGKMIEDLANFDLIDRVAEAIATRRQTGDTRGVEGRIAALQAQVTDAPAEDLAPLKDEVAEASRKVAQAEIALVGLCDQRAQLDVEGALRIVRDHEQRVKDIASLTYEIDQIDRALARPAVVGPNDIELAAARRAVEDEKHAARAAQLHAELKQADTAELWDESLEALEAEIQVVQTREADASHRFSDAGRNLTKLADERAERRRAADVEVAQLEGRLIKETTCALCQKDLSDVPEVVRTNTALARQITDRKRALESALEEIDRDVLEQRETRATAEREMSEARTYLKDLQVVVAVNNKVEQLYARAAEFIAVDRAGVPGKWRWTGPVLESVDNNAVNHLRHLETLQREAMEDAAARKVSVQRRAGLVTSRANDILLRDDLPLDEAKDRLQAGGDLDQEIRDVVAQLTSHQLVLQRLQAELATKEALAEQAARQLEQTRKQLAAAQAELAQMQKYNALIKKVRAARPAITNKLWNIVLGGVSKHLTEIRDQPSTITRADGIFKCNGYPASGLSGSAEDMLGLAMRITLTKTFLPGIDMLQLDEPGAACSDARETRMLGVLSTLNFGQIVMISHNPLVDAVADRIINV